MAVEQKQCCHARDIRRNEVFFSYLIRHIRRKRGISQVELSGRSGYTPSYISTVESGQAFKNIARSHHLIRELNFQPDCLHRCAGQMVQLMARQLDSNS
jgi:transcriptional regulator with XRE-family HTH domain